MGNLEVLPNKITKQWLDEQYSAGKIIPVKDLEDGCIYKGYCRNAELALWHEGTKKFYYVRYDYLANDQFIEEINSLEDDDGHDLYIPYYKVDDEENEEILLLKKLFTDYMK